MDEKRMPFMDFKIVNAKSLKRFKKTAKIWCKGESVVRLARAH